MGMMAQILDLLFGGQHNVIKQTAEVFRENSEAGAVRAARVQRQAMQQFGQEFAVPRRGGFDRFMDGLNRLPRPALALGTLGLFITAMVNPLWFAQRMQGIALVPEPLWWLLGVIVSFYFGARHQVKAQQFQREIVTGMVHLPQVMKNIGDLEHWRGQSPAVAGTGPEARLELESLTPEDNPALADWQAHKG
jgi:hypothetical protein